MCEFSLLFPVLCDMALQRERVKQFIGYDFLFLVELVILLISLTIHTGYILMTILFCIKQACLATPVYACFCVQLCEILVHKYISVVGLKLSMHRNAIHSFYSVSFPLMYLFTLFTYVVLQNVRSQPTNLTISLFYFLVLLLPKYNQHVY